MKIEIELDLDRVRIEKVLRCLPMWTDRRTYDVDVRRILWAVDAAIREKEETAPNGMPKSWRSNRPVSTDD